MIPIRLEVKNFLPYRAPDALRFEGIHLACLTGANGAGKSSLLDAMTWALWGKARAKRDEELIHLGQSDMLVQLDFEQDGLQYRVIRKRTRSGRSQGTLDLFAYDEADNGYNSIGEGAVRATQQKIERLVRLDYDTFVHSAFLQQGKADAFTTRTPAQRKQILADILGLEQWTRYDEAAREHQRAVGEELNIISLRLEEIETELAREPGLQEQLAEAETMQTEAQVDLDAAEARLAEVAHASADLRNARERLSEQQRRQREHERDLQSINEDSERQMQRIAGFEAVIERRDDIEAGYAALQAAREADHALGDKLRELSDYEAQHHALQRQLDGARAELESEAHAHETTITELERALEGVNDGDLEAVREELVVLEGLQKEREQLGQAISQLGEERGHLQGMQQALEAEGKGRNERLASLEIIEDAACPLCGQPLDNDHRQQIIDQLIAERDEHRETYRANKDRIAEIKALTDGHQADVAAYDLELKQLNTLTRREGELQAQLDNANEAAARLDEANAALQAIRTLLADDSYAQDIREQLAVLEAQRAEIGYDRESHDSAREQLDAYQGYDARQKELDIALNALPDAQKALEGAQLRHERTEAALVEDAKKIETLDAEIEQLVVLVQEQQERQQEVNRLRTVERIANERLVTARQELAALESQRERKLELQARQEQKQHEKTLYDELRLAFGKNGIPAMIIETAIPELETAANRLLGRMTDGRMQLAMNTQREKVTGGMAETLEIQIADELGTRSYELYSGGESFRINFALRVALSQMLARRAGAQLRTLFIDEGFGTQDAEGRDRLVEAITAIQEDFDLILVITHIDELRDSFPVHVMVEKTTSGSSVSVR